MSDSSSPGAPSSPSPPRKEVLLEKKPAEPSWTALCSTEEQWSLVAYSKKPAPAPPAPLRSVKGGEEALVAARAAGSGRSQAPFSKHAERALLGSKAAGCAASAPVVSLSHALPPKPAGEGRRAKRAAAENAGSAGAAISVEHLATRDLLIRVLEPSALKSLASLSRLCFGSNDSDVVSWERLVVLVKTLAAIPALRITAELQTSTSKAMLSCGSPAGTALIMQPSPRKGRELHSMGIARGPIIAAMAVRTFLVDCAKVPIDLF